MKKRLNFKKWLFLIGIQFFILYLIYSFFYSGIENIPKAENKTDLIGIWKSTKSANVVELQFFKDSLIYNAWKKKTKFSWDCDGTKIYYTQLTNIEPELETKFIMEYRLNLEKDTLFVKNSESEFTNEFTKKTVD